MGFGNFLAHAGIGARVFAEQEAVARKERIEDEDRVMRRADFDRITRTAGLEEERTLRQNREAQRVEEGNIGEREAIKTRLGGLEPRTVTLNENQNELGPSGGIGGRVVSNRDVTFTPQPSRLDGLTAAADYRQGRGEIAETTKFQGEIDRIKKEGGLKLLEAYRNGAQDSELEKIFNETGDKQVVPGTLRVDSNGVIDAIDARTGKPMGKMNLKAMLADSEIGRALAKERVDIEYKKSQIAENQGKTRVADADVVFKKAYGDALGVKATAATTAAENRVSAGGSTRAARASGSEDIRKGDLPLLKEIDEIVMKSPEMLDPATGEPSAKAAQVSAAAQQLATANRGLLPRDAVRIAATGRPDYQRGVDAQGRQVQRRVLLAVDPLSKKEVMYRLDDSDEILPAKPEAFEALKKYISTNAKGELEIAPVALAEFENKWPGQAQAFLEQYKNESANGGEFRRSGETERFQGAPGSVNGAGARGGIGGRVKPGEQQSVAATVGLDQSASGDPALAKDLERFAPPPTITENARSGKIVKPNPGRAKWDAMTLQQKIAYANSRRFGKSRLTELR